MDTILKELKLESLNIIFKQVADADFDLSISKEGNDVSINYAKKCHQLRAIGILKTRLKEEKFLIKEKSQLENLSYLIDVARDAVPTLKTLKAMALNLALLGYSRIFINFEDLITLEDEPYFGYLRGKYSKAELKEYDQYCLSLGIEVIPCVQTLAHLNAMFFWPEYSEIKDTNDILLAGHERTYNLINKEFNLVRECFTTKLVHIGMDEAGMVGRGRYLDINGYHKPSEVMLKHLTKVAEIAKDHGLKPQMWSDMFFRLAFDGYYTKTGTLPKEIVELVPKGIEQVYWDYVTDDKDMLDNMIKNHKMFKGPTSFASGGWKWNGWNPSNKFSIYLAKYQLKACKKNGINNVMLTAWSDDGAEASIYSILPTIIYYAEYIYSGNTTKKHLETISRNLFGVGYQAMLDSDLTLVEESEKIENYNHLNYSNLPKITLYNDPLSGPYLGILERFSYKSLPDLTKKMRRYSKQFAAYSLYFKNLENLCKCLEIKYNLTERIRAAYQQKDNETLSKIANKDIPLLIKNIDKFIDTFYQQWMKENKTNSFEVHAIRLGGLKERLSSVRRLLNSYIKREKDHIEELEIEVVKMKDFDALLMVLWTVYKKMNSVNVF